MPTRIRIDRLLVERGLFESRAKAQAAIAAGLVTADDVPVTKPSAEISADAVLHAAPAHPWVSRGGVKLAAALDHFGIDPPAASASTSVPRPAASPRCCSRAAPGASTPSTSAAASCIRACADAREIVSLEATDIRKLDPARLAERPDFVTVDVSFISLKLVLPAALALARPARAAGCADQAAIRGRAAAHVKKGHRARSGKFMTRSATTLPASSLARLARRSASSPRPIAGGDGNHEFLIAAP